MIIRTVSFGIMIFCLFAAPLFGQQLTTVAVVDAQRVYDSFSKGSGLSYGIDSIRLRYQERIDTQLANIQDFERQKNALTASEAAKINELSSRIALARSEIDRLNRLRTQELRTRQQFISPNNFIPELQRAIIFIAESKGYTVVFSAEDKGLQWWSPIVDITDDVISRLVAQLSQ